MNESCGQAVEKSKTNLIWVGVGLGISYWLFESVRGALVYPKGNIFEGTFAPGTMILWTRLLVVCIIVLFGVLVQTLRKKAEERRRLQSKIISMHGIILAGLGFGVFYWILESFRGSFLLNKSNFYDCLIATGPSGLWMRLLTISILFVFSLYAQSLVNKLKQSGEELQMSSDKLERLVLERTEEFSERTAKLSEANASLKKEIAERKQMEQELRRTNMVQRALNECKLQIMRAKEDPDLLDKVCDALVGEADYCFVWVGLVEEDPENRHNEIVRPVCSKGREDGYLETLSVTLEDTALDPNPVSETLRTGKAYIEKDLFNSYNNTPWRAEATKRGFASMVCIPLGTDDATFGVINIFAQDAAAFQDTEVSLLIDLADDLALGIAAVEAPQQPQRAEEEK